MAEPILDVRAVSVGYGKTQVLWDISLAVPQDQRIGPVRPQWARQDDPATHDLRPAQALERRSPPQG